METDTKKIEVQCTKDRKPDPEILKTWEMWNEAGFTPPDLCMYLVEQLHCMYSGESSPGCTPAEQINEEHFNKFCSGLSPFDIHDTKKMRDYARANNIPEEKMDDGLVAVSITAAIISDYFRDENCGLYAGKKTEEYFP